MIDIRFILDVSKSDRGESASETNLAESDLRGNGEGHYYDILEAAQQVNNYDTPIFKRETAKATENTYVNTAF